MLQIEISKTKLLDYNFLTVNKFTIHYQTFTHISAINRISAQRK